MKLDAAQQGKLTDYVDNQLLKDLDLFEQAYGYRGNRFLAQWLILNNVFPAQIDFTARDGMYYILYDLHSVPFIHNLTQRNFLNKHAVGSRDIGELISVFTSFVEIGNDGRGGRYYATFFLEKNEVFVFDHDPEEYVKLPKTLVTLMKAHPIKKIYPFIEEIVEKNADRLGFKSILNQPKKVHYSVKKMMTDWYDLLKMIKGLTEIKPFTNENYDRYSYKTTKFDSNHKIVQSILNKDSNYYLYNDYRAVCNSVIARNYYWYFFTGQIETLKKYIRDTVDIKGEFYQAIRIAFEKLANRDESDTDISYDEIEKVRGVNGIELKKFIYFIENKTRFKTGSNEALFEMVLEKVIKMERPKLIIFSNGGISNGMLSVKIGMSISEEMLIPYWSKLSFLNHLEIDNCGWTKVPKEIGLLSNLKRLSFNRNKISKLSNELNDLKHLQQLSIDKNELKSIPALQLPSLINLSLSENKFEKIPNEVWNHSHLQGLWMDDNQIKVISKEIIKVKSLNFLSLNNNFISELPDEITHINSIQLKNNQLTEYPKKIVEKLAYPQLLRLEGNRFNS